MKDISNLKSKKLVEDLLTEASQTIYYDTEQNKAYKWDGSKYVEVKLPKDSKDNKPSKQKGGSALPKQPPQIGDKGDGDEADKEDAEREEQAAKEGNTESKKDYEARLQKIKDKLADENIARKASDEAESQVAARNSAKERREAEKQARKFKENPMVKFKVSLDKFIRREIADSRESTWKRPHKSYAGTPIVKKGIATKEFKGKPLLNVYFDRSGSWGADKTAIGESAIATLHKYEKEGKLKIRVYYFHDHEIETDMKDKDGHGGTYGEPIVRHIKETKPDNVVIMTDDDIDRTDGYDIDHVTVPGAVWFLFPKHEVCDSLMKDIRGKKQNKIYEIGEI